MRIITFTFHLRVEKLRQLNHFVVNQASLAKPCRHQNYRTFACLCKFEQRISIADLYIVSPETFVVQRLFRKSNNLFSAVNAFARSCSAMLFMTLLNAGAILRCSAVK